MRYRLRTLMIATFLAALVCLALRSPTRWWSGGLFSALLFTMLTAVLVAIYRSGQVRAMAIGFLVFSSGYLLVESGFLGGNSSGLKLLTEELIGWTFNKLHPADLRPGIVQPAADDPFAIVPPGADPFALMAPPEQLSPYRTICITALAVVFGLIGAAVAQLLERTSRNAVTPEP